MDFTKSQQTNPDQQYRQQFLNYVKQQNEEQYTIYDAINKLQFKYLQIRKEGKSHDETVSFLMSQEA